jgi:hypothetical protein
MACTVTSKNFEFSTLTEDIDLTQKERVMVEKQISSLIEKKSKLTMSRSVLLITASKDITEEKLDGKRVAANLLVEKTFDIKVIPTCPHINYTPVRKSFERHNKAYWECANPMKMASFCYKTKCAECSVDYSMLFCPELLEPNMLVEPAMEIVITELHGSDQHDKENISELWHFVYNNFFLSLDPKGEDYEKVEQAGKLELAAKSDIIVHPIG